jgi:hypothetical protein
MPMHTCECEHEVHFAPDDFRKAWVHDYGKAKAFRQVSTPYGKFWTCIACAKAGHMGFQS